MGYAAAAELNFLAVTLFLKAFPPTRPSPHSAAPAPLHGTKGSNPGVPGHTSFLLQVHALQ